MFTKRNTKSAVIALLIASSCIMSNNEAYGLKLNIVEAAHEKQEVATAPAAEPKEEIAANPDFVSLMTTNQWKLYGPEETLELYKRAEYKANMEEHKAESFKTNNAAAKDNLEEARGYLK